MKTEDQINKHEVLRAFLIAAISVWTIKDHPWNYIANKIAQCWRQYELDCNNNRIEWFWFGQFDSENTVRFTNTILDTWILQASDIRKIYHACSTKGIYSLS